MNPDTSPQQKKMQSFPLNTDAEYMDIPGPARQSTFSASCQPKSAPRPVPRPRKQNDLAINKENDEEMDMIPNRRPMNDQKDDRVFSVKPKARVDQYIKTHQNFGNMISQYRKQIEIMILQNMSQDNRHVLVDRMLSVNCQIEEKYETLDVLNLLKNNQYCVLTKIPLAFNILEKYATNLLKPKQHRHLSWRTVQFASNAFQQKVKFLNGGLDILHSLGYTDSIMGNDAILGLSFPHNVEPNITLVLTLAVDLTIAKFEVEAILNGVHPNIEAIKISIPSVFYLHGLRNADSESNSRSSFDATGNQNYTSLGSSESHDSLGSDSKITFALNKPILSNNAVDSQNKCAAWQEKKTLPSMAETRSSAENQLNFAAKPLSMSNKQDDFKLDLNLQLKRCPTCQEICDMKARFCSGCGAKLTETKTVRKNIDLPHKVRHEVPTTPSDQPTAQLDDTMWECIHCTFKNPAGTSVCEMCDKTSWKIDSQQHANKNLATKSPGVSKTPNNNKMDGKEDVNRSAFHGKQMYQTAPVKVPDSPYEQKDLGQYILIDKKQTFNRSDRASMFQTAPQQNVSNTPFEFDKNGMSSNQQKSLATPSREPVIDAISPISPIIMEEVQKKIKLKKEQEQQLKDMREHQIREVAIAKQDEMKKNAQRLVSLMKYAENNGFTVDECYVATRNVKDHTEASILNWLKLKWPSLIDEIVALCTDLFGKDETIGPISFEEAKKLLLECDGEKEKTVQVFLEERRRNIDELKRVCDTFENKNILNALFKSGGDVEKARLILTNEKLEGFRKRIWGKSNPEDFYDKIKDETLPSEVKHRMLIGEYGLSLGRAKNCMKLVLMKGFMIEDCIAAAESNQFLDQCLNYLNHECETCFCSYPVHKLVVNLSCQCCFCIECYVSYIKITLSEKHIRHLICPMCQKPNLENPPPHYFDNLGQQIRYLVKEGKLLENIYETFDTKLRDFSLLREKNFRWCAHCGNGFLWDDLNQIRMTCDRCKQRTCFKCKEKWEDQHENVSCEQFKAWKEANDPELQHAGVAALLAKNGLVCPYCQFRYDLARGGCMHFKCTQCGFEFCSGCSQGFRQGAQCLVHAECAHLGLHAHHPRDCLNYLRDRSAAELQKLLADNNVEYNTDIPEEKKVDGEAVKCDMMEQKEVEGGYKDEQCGKDAPENMAGICKKHYLEYLVALINYNGLDPVDLMNVHEAKLIYRRKYEDELVQNDGEAEEEYLKRLRQDIRDRFPLPVRRERLLPPPGAPSSDDEEEVHSDENSENSHDSSIDM